MKQTEVKKNENKKSFFDLLNIAKLPDFRYREIEGKIDIFFPSKDIFIYLNIFESFVFKKLFVEDIKEDIFPVIEKNFSLKTEETNKKLNKFLIELSRELK